MSKEESKNFPRWIYHKEHRGMIVHSEAAEKALGPGWGEMKVEYIKIWDEEDATASKPKPLVEEKAEKPKSEAAPAVDVPAVEPEASSEPARKRGRRGADSA